MRIDPNVVKTLNSPLRVLNPVLNKPQSLKSRLIRSGCVLYAALILTKWRKFMNLKKLGALLVLALTIVLGLVMFGGGKSRAAAPCSVPSVAYPTIQSAVNDPSCAVINVLPGIYAENVTISRQLTLSGAGNTTVIHPIVTGPGITLTAGGSSSSSRTVIENFEITGALGGGNTGSGISIQGGAGPIGFITFDHVTSTANGGHGIAINNSANMSDIVISDSSLSNNTGLGLRIPSSMLSLDGLTITDSHLDGNASGWETYTATSATDGPLTNVTVSGTTFDNNLNKGMYFERLNNASFTNVEVMNSGTGTASPAGIDINLKYAAFSNISITDSKISGSTGNGLAIKGRNDAPSYNTHPASLTGVTGSGLDVSGNAIGISIGNNVTGVQINESNIQGNSSAGLVEYTDAGVIDATCNWWGSATGPANTGNPGGTGNAVVSAPGGGTVNFTPWLIAPAPFFCGTSRKECEKYYDQQKKDFDDGQKAAKKDFDDQQKTEKDAWEASHPHPTPAQRKAFDDSQKAAKKQFDDQQKADDQAFDEQNKANKEQCKSLPN